MIKKAIKKQVVTYEIIDLFEYTNKLDHHIDDYPFGGGDGMVMKPDPIFKAFDSIKTKIEDNTKVIYPTPDGIRFSQAEANKLTKNKSLVFICGHYKGVDHRVRDYLITKEISIGNFVLSGGELPAAILCDSIIRLIPGVIGDESSALSDSFQDNVVSAPIYTRPANYKGLEVPDILISGNQKEIEKWKDQKSLERTKLLRPKLFDNL